MANLARPDDKVFDDWLVKLVTVKGVDILWVRGIVFPEGIEHPFVFKGGAARL